MTLKTGIAFKSISNRERMAMHLTSSKRKHKVQKNHHIHFVRLRNRGKKAFAIL